MEKQMKILIAVIVIIIIGYFLLYKNEHLISLGKNPLGSNPENSSIKKYIATIWYDSNQLYKDKHGLTANVTADYIFEISENTTTGTINIDNKLKIDTSLFQKLGLSLIPINPKSTPKLQLTINKII